VPDQALENSLGRLPDELRAHLGKWPELPADLIKAGQLLFLRDFG
jgi:hypothetical protein